MEAEGGHKGASGWCVDWVVLACDGIVACRNLPAITQQRIYCLPACVHCSICPTPTEHSSTTVICCWTQVSHSSL